MMTNLIRKSVTALMTLLLAGAMILQAPASYVHAADDELGPNSMVMEGILGNPEYGDRSFVVDTFFGNGLPDNNPYANAYNCSGSNFLYYDMLNNYESNVGFKAGVDVYYRIEHLDETISEVPSALLDIDPSLPWNDVINGAKNKSYESLLNKAVTKDYSSDTGSTLSGDLGSLQELRTGYKTAKDIKTKIKTADGLNSWIEDVNSLYQHDIANKLLPSYAEGIEKYTKGLGYIYYRAEGHSGEKAEDLGSIFDAEWATMTTSEKEADNQWLYSHALGEFCEGLGAMIDFCSDIATITTDTLSNALLMESLARQRESLYGTLVRTSNAAADQGDGGFVRVSRPFLEIMDNVSDTEDPDDKKATMYGMMEAFKGQVGKKVNKVLYNEATDIAKKALAKVVAKKAFSDATASLFVEQEVAKLSSIIKVLTAVGDQATGFGKTCENVYDMVYLNRIRSYVRSAYEQDVENYLDAKVGGDADAMELAAGKALDDLAFAKQLTLLANDIGHDLVATQTDSWVGILEDWIITGDSSELDDARYEKMENALVDTLINPYRLRPFQLNGGVLRVTQDSSGLVAQYKKEGEKNFHSMAEPEFLLAAGIDLSGGTLEIISNNAGNILFGSIGGDGNVTVTGTQGDISVGAFLPGTMAIDGTKDVPFYTGRISGTRLTLNQVRIICEYDLLNNAETILQDSEITVAGKLDAGNIFSLTNSTITVGGDANGIGGSVGEESSLVIEGDTYTTRDIEFSQETSYARFGGNLTLDSTWCSFMKGTIEFQGDVTCIAGEDRHNGWEISLNGFNMIFSGDRIQNVTIPTSTVGGNYANYGTELVRYFNYLGNTTVTSPGICGNGAIRIEKLMTDIDLYGDIEDFTVVTSLRSGSIRSHGSIVITGEMEVGSMEGVYFMAEGGATLKGTFKVPNGTGLTFDGDLTLESGGENGTSLYIDGGDVEVRGDLVDQVMTDAYAYRGVNLMSGSLTIGGDLIFRLPSGSSPSKDSPSQFKSGTLELKGDLIVEEGSSGFMMNNGRESYTTESGTSATRCPMKVIFSGEQTQTVDFQNLKYDISYHYDSCASGLGDTYIGDHGIYVKGYLFMTRVMTDLHVHSDVRELVRYDLSTSYQEESSKWVSGGIYSESYSGKIFLEHNNSWPEKTLSDSYNGKWFVTRLEDDAYQLVLKNNETGEPQIDAESIRFFPANLDENGIAVVEERVVGGNREEGFTVDHGNDFQDGDVLEIHSVMNDVYRYQYSYEKGSWSRISSDNPRQGVGYNPVIEAHVDWESELSRWSPWEPGNQYHVTITYDGCTDTANYRMVEGMNTPDWLDVYPDGCDEDDRVKETRVQLGGSAQLKVDSKDPDAEYVYSWSRYNQTTGVFEPISGASRNSLTVDNVTQQDLYRCNVKEREPEDEYDSVYYSNVFFRVLIDNRLHLRYYGESDEEMSLDYGEEMDIGVRVTGKDLSDVTYRWTGDTEGLGDLSKAVISYKADRARDLVCTATDRYGNKESLSFHIVLNNPQVVLTPKDGKYSRYVDPGDSVTLEVTADRPFDESSVRWQYLYQDDSSGYQDIDPDAENPLILTTGPINSDMVYRVTVTDAAGEESYLELNIYCVTSMIVETNQTGSAPGKPCRMEVEVYSALSEPITYEWYYQDPETSDFVVMEETGPVLETLFTRDATVQCIIRQGGFEKTATFWYSPQTNLTINEKKTLLDVPVGEEWTLSAEATTDADEGLQYQWYRGICAEEDADRMLPGETGETLQILMEKPFDHYYCRVTDGYESTVIDYTLYDSEYLIQGGTTKKAPWLQEGLMIPVDPRTMVFDEEAYQQDPGNPYHYMWFRFTPDSGGDYRISSERLLGLKAAFLYDKQDQLICSQEGSEDYTDELELTCSLEQGQTYWLKLHVTGGYDEFFGLKVEPLCEHEWDEGTIIKEATYEEDGLILYTCRKDPSHTRTEVIPRLIDHDQEQVDQERADEVTAVLNALEDVSEIGLEDQAAVEAARAAYDALTDDQKARVSESALEKLLAAEERLREIAESGDFFVRPKDGILDYYVDKGSDLTLEVIAQAYSGELRYQWQCEWEELEGETGSSLHLTNITESREYEVTVSDDGNMSSLSFHVYVNEEPDPEEPQNTDTEKDTEKEKKERAEAAAEDKAGHKPLVQVEKEITGKASDKDPAKSVFKDLSAKASKVTNNSIKVQWNKVSGASGYAVYAAKSGKNKLVKAAELGSGARSTTLKKAAGANLSKNTYYKVVVLAYKTLSSGEKRVISTSKIIHAATAGGKNGNPAKIKAKSKVTVKVKKTVKLKAKQTAKKKTKIKKYRGLSYESSNPKIATVNSKGVVKGLKKGKCVIYVYAQNGLFKKVTVTVK